MDKDAKSSVPWFIKGLPAIVSSIVHDPVEAFFRARTRVIAWKTGTQPFHDYRLDKNWRRRLRAAIGISNGDAFADVLAKVLQTPELAGVRIGPQTFGIWNDGDPALLEAVWLFTRHLGVTSVVETGVARGLTSRIVLEALPADARLWSIDLPPALDRHLVKEIGIAVPSYLRERWMYIEGSSRRHLSKLLSKLGEIDLFIHDSMHTEDNVKFEMKLAWSALKPGGAMVIDDIDLNRAFYDFLQTSTVQFAAVCQSEPLQPDVCRFRFENTGLFGIAIKPR